MDWPVINPLPHAGNPDTVKIVHQQTENRGENEKSGESVAVTVVEKIGEDGGFVQSPVQPVQDKPTAEGKGGVKVGIMKNYGLDERQAKKSAADD